MICPFGESFDLARGQWAESLEKYYRRSTRGGIVNLICFLVIYRCALWKTLHLSEIGAQNYVEKQAD